MGQSTNPELELAFDFVRNTNRSLFLTGKAGSGKTTFLHSIKSDGMKQMVVVAPTGVAAINGMHPQIPRAGELPPSSPRRLLRDNILAITRDVLWSCGSPRKR